MDKEYKKEKKKFPFCARSVADCVRTQNICEEAEPRPGTEALGQMNTLFMLTLQETAPKMRSATLELQRKCRLLKGFDRKVSNSYT